MGTSVRKDVAVGLADLDRHERIAALRARMDQVGRTPAPELVPEEPLPVPYGLKLQLLRKTVCHMSDTPALVVEFLRAVVEGGGFVAVVGWPELILAELGEKLEHVVLVPDPGQDPLNTVAVLTEGMDMVVYRAPSSIALSPVRARPLLAKLRGGHAALLLINAQVPSPQLTIHARITQFHGIGAGTGRIRGMDIEVRALGKTGRQVQTLRIGVGPQKSQLRAL